MKMDNVSETKMINALNGTNGQIELYEDKIIIKRNGITAKLTQGFFKGDKTVYINKISGVELKLAGNVFSGYIQFTIPGGIERRGGLFGKDGAANDENAVMFLKKYNDVAEEIKSYIEHSISDNNRPVNTSVSGADAIRQYKKLFDDGIITEREYELKKKEILRTM
jgi:hypothetical protein